MSKELEAFELLCRFLVEEINTLRHKDLNEDYFYNKKYGVFMTDKKTGIKYTTADISDALKRLEEQDNVFKILKEIIEFKQMLPHIEPNKNNGFDIMSAVSINIQRDIENKERELLRQWVLKTCFPKELTTLEIIKNVDKTSLLHFLAINVKDQKDYELVREALL